MKRVAWVVIVSLLTPGMASAQTTWSSVECGGKWTNVPVSTQKWDSMTSGEQNQMCEAYQPTPMYRMEKVSPKLTMAGVIAVLAGVSMVLNLGETEVDVLDEKYCVDTTYYSRVDYGGCGTSMEKKVGAILIGSGALAMFIGTREKKVTMQAAVGKKTLGVAATIQWGGSNGS